MVPDDPVSRVRQDVQERDRVRQGSDRTVTLLTRHSLAPIMAALCQPNWVRCKHRRAHEAVLLVFGKEGA